MSIFNKIHGQSKVQEKKAARKALFYRIYIYPETAEKIEELKGLLKSEDFREMTIEKEQAEIFRKIIGLAYYDIKNDMQNSNSNKIKKYRKVAVMKKNARKKKQVKEIWLKGAV
ncbi:MAG: hypothetical protein WC320_00565 [Candidatus Paceibacterota bacterium]|jgi:hypothetical protein